MKPIVWTPAADEHLLAMARRKIDIGLLAPRFGCTEKEVRERIDHLNALGQQPPPQSVMPTKDEDVEKLKANMDHVQQAFIDASLRYNQLGEKLRFFGDLVSQSLTQEELEDVFKKAFDQPRRAGETISQKMARHIFENCVVLLRPLTTTPSNGSTTNPP